MAQQIFITSVIGVAPYSIYICQVDGSNCIYIDTTSIIPFDFIIPESYDITNGFTLKVVDANGCQILD